MKKALIPTLAVFAALALTDCGFFRPAPAPDPAASVPADVSQPTAVPSPSPVPEPPAGVDPASSGGGSIQDPKFPADAGEPVVSGIQPAPADTEAEEPAEDPPEPPQTEPQSPPDAGEEAPRQAEETPDPGPDPADSSGSKSGQLSELIRAYFQAQLEQLQQSGGEYDPEDMVKLLTAYQEYAGESPAGSPEELRASAEELLPELAGYEIDWDAVWQTVQDLSSD